MASEVFFTHHHQHGIGGRNGGVSAVQRSVRPSHSGATLSFPPLYLDPANSSGRPETHTADGIQQPSSIALGSTFYHHPELHALVSSHLTDTAANANTGTTFLGPKFGGHHPDENDAEDAEDLGAYANTAVPRPRISQEFIALNEDLVPAPLDMHGDLLPSEQHPSYPFGNLFGPLSGTIPADSAIMGGPHVLGHVGAGSAGLSSSIAALGLDFGGGGLAAFTNLGQPSHGKRSAVASGWNLYTNKASRSKIVGSAGAPTEWGPESATESASRQPHTEQAETQAKVIRSARRLGMAPGLVFRSCTSAVLAPPTWPFRRHGPGSTSHSALLRPSSNIYGAAPASQALAATLGGLPASAQIIKEVWSDLALEELVPLHVGSTSATKLLPHGPNNSDTEDGRPTNSGKKRARAEPETDVRFAKRMAMSEPDPLDLLGPISREIRGQASRPWGTLTQNPPSVRQKRDTALATRLEDEMAEAEHDDPEEGYQLQDRLRYSFALPAAAYSWTEEPDDEEEEEDDSGKPPIVHSQPDGIGWSTAKRIFVNEQRDRVLPQLASRGDAGEVGAYQIRGLRANSGLLPRAAWSWGNGPPDQAGVSAQNNMSPSPTPSERELVDKDDSEGSVDERWQDDEAELQQALLQQYSQANALERGPSGTSMQSTEGRSHEHSNTDEGQ